MKHYVTLQIGFEDEPCFHKDGTVEFPEGWGDDWIQKKSVVALLDKLMEADAS